MKQLLLACLMIHLCLFVFPRHVESSLSNICENPTDETKWSSFNVHLLNYIVDKGFIDYRLVNASRFDECIRMCCDKVNCNYAFLKDSRQCFLVACKTDKSCKPLLNRSKAETDPIDHLVHVRSVGDSKRIIKSLMEKERNELLKIENTLVAAQAVSATAVEKNPSCIPNVFLKETNSPCPVNEVCVKRPAAAAKKDDADSSSGSKNDGYECVCPHDVNMRRVEGVCREYLSNMNACEMYLNECADEANEECVPSPQAAAERVKHGTCQCRLGFRRDPTALTYSSSSASSAKCVAASAVTDDESDEDDEEDDSEQQQHRNFVTVNPRTNRRRPSPPVSIPEEENMSKLKLGGKLNGGSSGSSGNAEESLWGRLLDELGIRNANNKKDGQADSAEKPADADATSSSYGRILGMLNTTATTVTITTTPRTMSSTTATATAITDAPNVHTNNLFADAGGDERQDVHVYYPSRMCILNGTRTRFIPRSASDSIERWLWTKSDTSPAFGQFVGTNEAPIVTYENMVEGVYKFMLKVWTSSKEYSQSSVHVYVHSTVNTNRTITRAPPTTSYLSTAANMPTFEYKQEQELNDNIIQIELDIEPNLFSEYLKERFRSRFQLMLEENRKQFGGLIKPRCVLLNTRIASSPAYSKKSTVVLELIVTDLKHEGLQDQDMSSMNTNGLVFDSQWDLVGENRRVVDNSALIRLMRRHQAAFQFSFSNINSVWAYFGKDPTVGAAVNEVAQHIKQQQQQQAAPYSMLDSLEIRVLSVSKLTCTSDYYAANGAAASAAAVNVNCSNHGRCDFYSHKCICDKYWMPNLYSYYLNYEADLTNGNNCEYNIPLVVVATLLVTVLVVVVVNILFKYFFYYMCCCCLCRRCCSTTSTKSASGLAKNRLGRKFNGDASYLEDDDLNSSDRSSLIKSNSKLKSINKFGNDSRHKYALLRGEETDNVTWRGSKPGDHLPSSALNYDDDEDVIYDESNVKKNRLLLATNKPKDEPVKKYSVI